MSLLSVSCPFIELPELLVVFTVVSGFSTVGAAVLYDPGAFGKVRRGS